MTRTIVTLPLGSHLDLEASQGRFLSVDPIVGNPLSTQSLNPYSYVMNNPLSGTDPTGYFDCDENHQCKGTIGEIETVKVYKDGTATATNKSGETITLGNVNDKAVQGTVGAFVTNAFLSFNGGNKVQGSQGEPSFAPGSIESITSRTQLTLSGQRPNKQGDPLGGAILSLGNSMSLGLGSFMFDEQDRADVGAFDQTYGTAAAVFSGIAALRNPATAVRSIEDGAEKALAREAIEEGESLSSSAARRQAMRDAGIPTTQQPIGQFSAKLPDGTNAGRQLTYEVPAAGGGTRRMVVTDQRSDRVPGHGPHWEAGAAKIPERKDPLGRVRVVNDKAKVEYEH